MSNWDDYKYEDRQVLEPGDYRVEIVSAEEATSQAGNPMIVVGIKPNGSGITIRDYFVKGQYFNNRISRFFDGFPELKGNFNFLEWVGCVGAARLKQDGEYLRVHYYLTPEQAEALPSWEGKLPERQVVTEITDSSDFSDLPF